MLDVNGITRAHGRRFGAEAAVFLAPGRVNLIGEHTDYAGGFVMPAAIDFGTLAAISRRSDGRVVIWSENVQEEVIHPLEGLPEHGGRHWSAYPLGVIKILRDAGYAVPALSLSVCGNVPLGAGLSSSASIEVATALAAFHLAGGEPERERIAKLCQQAENEYVGASCGIMDQFIACRGAEDHALLLDCRSLEYRLAPIPTHLRLVIANTMVKHAIAGGEYGNRRAEVEEGTRILRGHRPEILLLRDATLGDLEKWGGEMPDNVLRRCRHVITENLRTVAAADALEAGNLKKLGDLMAAAHASYRDDFEASCEEADAMVHLAQRLPGLVGARLTGGGFGGCTVNLVERERSGEFCRRLHDEYRGATGIDAEIYPCRASAAAHAVGGSEREA
ncbi:MAG TPA: galactokinase [Acidobacteriaceae bacterium]|jgi:galactokinase|nr:galactokinase [Acidobacteriaceae bacterium]